MEWLIIIAHALSSRLSGPAADTVRVSPAVRQGAAVDSSTTLSDTPDSPGQSPGGDTPAGFATSPQTGGVAVATEGLDSAIVTRRKAVA